MESPTRLSEPATGADALTRLIIEVPIIRSVSLVDTDGRVVASSSARNVGMTLTAADLPTLAIPLQSDEVKFGEAFPLRDLYELNSDRIPVDIGFWTAQRSVQIEGRDYRWLIAIDLGVFLNLWSEVDTDEATMILLVDENGRRIIDHHLKEKAFAECAIALVIERLSQARHGSIDSTDQRLQIAFQGSAAYPAAIIMIGDPALLPIMAGNLRNIPLAIAAASNVLLLSFIVLLFVFYLRYEKRSQELANQSRAIDMHLMVADLDREGRVLSGNKAFFEFNGYEPAELIGQPYTVLSTGQRTPEVRDAVCDLLRDELARSNAALASDANTDPLTGQPNKRAFDIFVEEARTASAREGKPLSLLMLDVDHFKRINDTRGHGTGDVVLQTLARRWSRELRSSDMLARMGGEEFCVVLPRTGGEAARRLAEKLRAVIAAVPVETEPENTEGEE